MFDFSGLSFQTPTIGGAAWRACSCDRTALAARTRTAAATPEARMKSDRLSEISTAEDAEDAEHEQFQILDAGRVGGCDRDRPRRRADSRHAAGRRECWLVPQMAIDLACVEESSGRNRTVR